MRYLAILFFTFLLAGCGTTQMTPERYVRTHDRPRHVEEAMMNGQVTEDMTKEEVRLSWGEPQTKAHQGGAAPTQWCYNNEAQCIYFRDGKVVRWE